MRYPPEHKQAARARLIEAGAALAKKEGFGNTGMDALTAAAGVTTGAFYSQFRSKPEFLRAIVEHELAKTLAVFQGKSAAEMLQVLDGYLSPRHVRHPEHGCPIPSLGAEVGRADHDTRLRFETLMKQLHDELTAALQDEGVAWTLICQAVGGVLIARAMGTDATRDEVLKAVLGQAEKLVQSTVI